MAIAGPSPRYFMGRAGREPDKLELSQFEGFYVAENNFNITPLNADSSVVEYINQILLIEIFCTHYL